MEMRSTKHHRRRQDGHVKGSGLARGLGWFSVGLGLAELGAPRALARLIGVPNNRATRMTLRILGARELVSGLGILARPERSGPVWSRVVGDAIDLALLGWALQRRRTHRERLAAAIVSVVGVTALDVYAGRSLARAASTEPAAATITVRRKPEEVYTFWKDFQHFPRFMASVDAVRVLDARRSHWTVKTPVGAVVEWDAEIVDDRPGERIAWRSLEGSEVGHRGEVTFRPAPRGRGTEVHVEMLFGEGGGKVGGALAKLFAEKQIEGDLSRFKQVLETGEVVHSDASIHRGMHPAQPSAGIEEHVS